MSEIAFDGDGKVLNTSIGEFNVPISTEQYGAMKKSALHITGGIDLPPGAVYLRVGVHELRTDKIGAFEIPLTVVAGAL